MVVQMTQLLHSEIVIIIVVVCLARQSLESAREPPRVRSNAIFEHKVRAGETVRLSCSIESDTPLIVEWEKDGRPIHIGWERFRVSDHDHWLRIKNTTLADRGIYVCRATNGFGSIEIQHKIDIGWSGAVLQTSSYLTPSVGDSLLLHCSNDSHLTSITWYKDGVVLSSYDVTEENKRWRNFSLALNDVTADDSGIYECRNDRDEVNVTYVIDVMKIKRKPVFVRLPENVTTTLNGRATFFCEVNSDHRLYMQWLKRLEPTEEAVPSVGAIAIGDSQFLPINRTESLRLSSGSYFSKLQIKNIRHCDVGFYVCVSTNTYGYVIAGAYLTLVQQGVLDSEETMNSYRNFYDPDSPFVSLVVVLIVLTLLVLFSVLSFAIYRSRFGKRSTIIDGTRSSIRSTDNPSTSPHDFHRPCADLLLAFDSDKRSGHRYQDEESALSLVRDGNCGGGGGDGGVTPYDPGQPRVATHSTVSGSCHSDARRKSRQAKSEMSSLRSQISQSDNYIIDNPHSLHCPYHHHQQQQQQHHHYYYNHQHRHHHNKT